ncbi:MAG TPA: hypothetical protein PKA27_01395 [Fimbriimonadaceae bacterium]|nr:hypothetical protein [Fimbriimonadaceae bacterium]
MILTLSGHVLEVCAPTFGRRHRGIPPGGPADRESATLAGALVGKEKVFECGPFPTGFEVISAGTFAVVGADLSVWHQGRPVNGNRRIHIEPGDVISIQGAPNGCRWYVATSPRSLPPITLAQPPESLRKGPFRVLPGADTTKSELFGREWTVTLHSNRLGLRLHGDPIDPMPEMLSSPTQVGCIQLPPSGQPIILGWDGPTVGGYPRIGQIAKVDWDRLGQLRPGDTVTFEQISREDAVQQLREREERISNLVGKILLSAEG